MSRAVQQARRFRKISTRHEKRLWWQLRDRKLGGLKFRRQVPIGERIVDFFCAEAHLAVELDGSGHCHHFTQTADLDRAIELHEKGIRITIHVKEAEQLTYDVVKVSEFGQLSIIRIVNSCHSLTFFTSLET